MGKSITDNIQEFTTATQNYIESSISYHKLDIYKKLMRVAVSSTHKILIGFVLLIAVLFLSIALSIYLGEVLDSTALGYLIVGLFYMIIVLCITLFMKPVIERKLLRKTSEQFFNSNEDIKIDQHESLH